MDDIVLMADPLIAAIPVRDCGERLVDLREDGIILIDPRKQDPDGDFCQVRQSVREKLTQAQQNLPDGLRLLFIEGYRPPALQRIYFDDYLSLLKKRNRGSSERELFALASRYVSPPDIAPHSAGAAIDITLATLDGTELDLGTKVNESPEESRGACFTTSGLVGKAARENRLSLSEALTAVGFINYPTEWWHWSYGDRYWAFATNTSSAHYAMIIRRGA